MQSAYKQYVIIEETDTISTDSYNLVYPAYFVYGSNVPCFATEEDVLEYFTTGNVAKALYCPEKIAGSGGDTEEVSSYMAEFAELARSEEYANYIVWYGYAWWNKQEYYPSGGLGWVTKDIYYLTTLDVNQSNSAANNYGANRKAGCKYAILINKARHYGYKSKTWSDIYLPCIYTYENGQMTKNGVSRAPTVNTGTTAGKVLDLDSSIQFNTYLSTTIANSLYKKFKSYVVTQEFDKFETDLLSGMIYPAAFTYGANVPCFATEEDILNYFTTGNLSNALFVPPGLETDGVTYVINDAQYLDAGEYILSGAPSLNYPGSYLAVEIGDKTYMDIGSGVTFKVTESGVIPVTAVLGNKYKYKNTLFEPMIRVSTDEDDTYKPYIGSIEERLNELEEVTDNPILLMTGTVTVGDIAAGATITVNVTPPSMPGYRPLMLMYVNNSASMKDVIPSAMSSTFVNESTSFELTNVGSVDYSNVTVAYNALLRRV